MLVLAHAHGAYPYFYALAARYAQEMNPSTEWHLLLDTDFHVPAVAEVLNRERIHVIGMGSAKFPGAVQFEGMHEAIDAEKWHFKSRVAKGQETAAGKHFAAVRNLITALEPDAILASSIESISGKVMCQVARSVGIPLAVPTSCRNLGGLYFAADEFETLPDYARASPETVSVARTVQARCQEDMPGPVARIQRKADDVWNLPLPAFHRRVAYHLKSHASGTAGYDRRELLAAFRRTAPGVERRLANFRSSRRQRHVNDLMSEDRVRPFVFFPLQYTPESSINSLAPKYVDQMRLIDEIRHSLPSDFLLVVKEHPAALAYRKGDLLARLRRTSGVRLAATETPSIDLIRAAELTVSATGTAVMEAFLLNRYAASAARCLPSQLVGKHFSPMNIVEAMNFNRELSAEAKTGNLARVLSARYEVNFGTPASPETGTLSRVNVEAFALAFSDHLSRVTTSGAGAGDL